MPSLRNTDLENIQLTKPTYSFLRVEKMTIEWPCFISHILTEYLIQNMNVSHSRSRFSYLNSAQRSAYTVMKDKKTKQNWTDGQTEEKNQEGAAILGMTKS